MIEVEHVTNEGVTNEDLVRGIAWAMGDAVAEDGDNGSIEIDRPRNLWVNYRVEASK